MNLRWRRVESIAVAVALLLAWAVIARFEWVSPIFLPGPAATFDALRHGLAGGELLALTGATVERLFYGWAIASLIGIALGALIGISPALRTWLQPTLELIRPLPASAIVPIAIFLLGLSPAMVLVVITFGAMWPVLLATAHGFASIEPRLFEVGRMLQLSPGGFIFKIGLPNALPDALAGMRLSLTVSLILAVVGETLASQPGLGTAILQAARSFRAADLYAGVVLLGAIGFLSNSLLGSVERRLLRWRLA